MSLPLTSPADHHLRDLLVLVVSQHQHVGAVAARLGELLALCLAVPGHSMRDGKSTPMRHFFGSRIEVSWGKVRRIRENREQARFPTSVPCERGSIPLACPCI